MLKTETHWGQYLSHLVSNNFTHSYLFCWYIYRFIRVVFITSWGVLVHFEITVARSCSTLFLIFCATLQKSSNDFLALRTNEEWWWVRSPPNASVFLWIHTLLVIVATNSTFSSSSFSTTLLNLGRKSSPSLKYFFIFQKKSAHISLDDEHFHRIWLKVSISNPQIGQSGSFIIFKKYVILLAANYCIASIRTSSPPPAQ